jgi:hypothetical protein
MEIRGKATGGRAVAWLILFLCPIVLYINRGELSGGKETMFETMFFSVSRYHHLPDFQLFGGRQ